MGNVKSGTTCLDSDFLEKIFYIFRKYFLHAIFNRFYITFYKKCYSIFSQKFSKKCNPNGFLVTMDLYYIYMHAHLAFHDKKKLASCEMDSSLEEVNSCIILEIYMTKYLLIGSQKKKVLSY